MGFNSGFKGLILSPHLRKRYSWQAAYVTPKALQISFRALLVARVDSSSYEYLHIFR